jgi:predicted transcriptional regulator YheO
MDAKFEPYRPVCDAIALLLSPHAEVVMHDLETEQIAYIANCFSKRRPGDDSLIGSSFDLKEEMIGPYPRKNSDGRRLKSITSILRDSHRKPFGLLCINLEIESLAGSLELIQSLIAMPAQPKAAEFLLAKDWQEAVNEAMSSFLTERSTTRAGLTSEDIDNLLLELDRKGIFEIRKAVPYVAEVLELSRATIYNRLAGVRNREEAMPDEAGA